MIESNYKTERNISSEEKLESVLSYFKSLVLDSTPSDIPESISDIPEVQIVTEIIHQLRNVLYLAKSGDFSYTIKGKGFIIGTLKALQSNLNHIAWIARQVAGGDLEQRMSFMGDFSSAFNSMTEQLATVLKELKEQKEHFSQRALHDSLTGLKNRAFFDEHILYEVARAKRNNSFLAVVMIDIDKFKQVNDTRGHHIGDTLLIEVANRLSQSTREIDTVARLGGDEFGMLFPCDANNKQHFIMIRDRILSNISSYFELEGSEYKISVSIGISVYPFDGSNPDELLNVADSFMYQAKKIDGPACFISCLA